MPSSRRQFMSYFSAAGLGGTLFPGTLWTLRHAAGQQTSDDAPITVGMIEQAEQIAGLTFSPEQRELMVEDVNDNLDAILALRERPLPNETAPALIFDPARLVPVPPAGPTTVDWQAPGVSKPASSEALAFLPVTELAALMRAGEVTSVELTRLYLSRLKQYDPVLKCVVTLTEERALQQAAERDAELAAGTWRGPLHGIPWGAKDLLAVEGYPTTWGAVPYQNQVIDQTAEVVKRLDEAGAVLVAKLTLGALAWGDVWFGGRTNNPWNIEQGSSGSSAGSGSAVAAGLVGFALGTETLGSIVSPSTRNGVTGLRPTFGRVSRHGAMALSWSMDKIGPMVRHADDAALVFAAIHGQDANDPFSRDAAFTWPVDPKSLRVGYFARAFEAERPNADVDAAVLDVLRGAGFELQPIDLPADYPLNGLLLTLGVEAAAAFDDLTRSGGTDAMVRQIRNAWPNVFRTSRLVPAVEYVQANRLRTQLLHEVERVMEAVDVFVTPSFGGGVLQITNLTGHPTVVVPNGFLPVEDAPAGSPRRQPTSISFVAGLDKDAAALSVAAAYQAQTDFHRRRPPVG